VDEAEPTIFLLTWHNVKERSLDACICNVNEKTIQFGEAFTLGDDKFPYALKDNQIYCTNASRVSSFLSKIIPFLDSNYQV
jgi:hypothetical protein